MTTSVQIEQQIEQLDERAKALESQIRAVTDLDAGLVLQGDMDSLTAYRTRLSRQLVEVQAQERTDQKRRNETALEQEIAELEASYTDQRNAVINIYRELLGTFLSAYQELEPKWQEMLRLRGDHENTFQARYDRLPPQNTVMTDNAFIPDDLEHPELAHALYLLNKRELEKKVREMKL